MALASPSSAAATTTKPPAMEPSPSRLLTSSSDAGAGAAGTAASLTGSSSSPAISCSDSPDRADPSNSSPGSCRDVDIQSATILRSEEYRQLFRLPPEEVLVEDFNCALQENILIQGHMYLFVHFICFYSNIFGFETKKLIPFNEVTSVRRAKTAGIFPNAIEIFAGSKKYFFASFISRDDAFKLINDGWLENSNGDRTVSEQQDTSVTSSPMNGVAVEKVDSFRTTTEELDFTDRNIDNSIPKDLEPPLNTEEGVIIATNAQEIRDSVDEEISRVPNTNSSSSESSMWKPENKDAPQIPEGYTMVAESEFQELGVEDFFNYFFSDSAVDFIETFHKNCGDKEFKCNSWYPHEKFGHAREVAFQHPIKIYFGAKFGACQETQKFRLYRSSHLVIETSQEISDVPYGDYFRVEALWDVKRDESKGCCLLRVYVNVAFSKRTVWKGKIVQSTLEECREAYATWMTMAHELLKKNLENQEEKSSAATVVANVETHSEREVKDVGSSETPYKLLNEHLVTPNISSGQHVNSPFQGKIVDVSSFASWLRESVIRVSSSLKSQGNLSLVVVIIFFVILLMQLSILALLARPQHIHVSSPADYAAMNAGGGARSSEALAWLEKRMHHLKDEMYMVEVRLERMRNEHTFLKAQLDELIKRR